MLRTNVVVHCEEESNAAGRSIRPHKVSHHSSSRHTIQHHTIQTAFAYALCVAVRNPTPLRSTISHDDTLYQIT